jgi:hypothetical protein
MAWLCQTCSPTCRCTADALHNPACSSVPPYSAQASQPPRRASGIFLAAEKRCWHERTLADSPLAGQRKRRAGALPAVLYHHVDVKMHAVKAHHTCRCQQQVIRSDGSQMRPLESVPVYGHGCQETWDTPIAVGMLLLIEIMVFICVWLWHAHLENQPHDTSSKTHLKWLPLAAP